MNRRLRIAIVVLRDSGPLDDLNYLLRLIGIAWREKGHEVWVHMGPQPDADGDIAILHVDRTVVPEEYVEYLRRFPVTINGAVTDISKRRISRHLVRRTDGYDGPVIVKTNANSGGEREACEMAAGTPIERYISALRGMMPWCWQPSIPTEDYPIFASRTAVPYPVWLNPDLVVERFLPETDGDLFAVRTWLFLGDQEMSTRGWADTPVIKGHHIKRRDDSVAVPDELRKLRHDLGFEYGKFDFGIVDGRVVLYDANRTPTLGGRSQEEYMRLARRLAHGIEGLL